MRGLGYVFIVLGVIVLLLGLLNHWVMKLNPVNHTSTIVIVVGVVLGAIGVIAMLAGGRSAAA